MATARLFSLLVVITFAGAAPAWSQRPPALPQPVGVQAALDDGWMSGVVTDQEGVAVRGARVLASGTVLAIAVTDSRGRFTLILPMGDYLVRASRPGFLSTYREPVRVQPNRGTERRILLTREALAADSAVQDSPAELVEEDDRHRHSEMAWRLRHLKRTVLRSVAPAPVFEDDPHPALASGLAMSGYVNLLTAGSVGTAEVEGAATGSHGIANIFLAAPAGQAGQWSLRAAMSGGSPSSSWALRGEFGTRTVERHDVRLAVSYGKHGLEPSRGESLLPAAFEARQAGSLEVDDRWIVRPTVALDYGVRLDHYDYLSGSALVSPHAVVRLGIRPGTSLRASAEQRAVAPGAHDFRAPSASGLWLPAVHTYTLAPDRWVEPQRTRRYLVGLEQAVGASGAATLSVHWLSEQTDNQMATLFGMDGEGGRYELFTMGDVALAGWRVGLEGALAPQVNGRLQYTEARVRWGSVPAPVRPQPVPGRSLLRTGPENVSDLRAAVDVILPVTSTRLVMAYQISRLDAVDARSAQPTLVDNGFDLEIRQPLPSGLLDSRPVHLLFSVSTLFHESGADPLLDEALTVRPPARVTAGIQVGF